MSEAHAMSPRSATRFTAGKLLSYIMLVTWAAMTILPLVWMGYSAFKSNEEIGRNTYTLPHDLFANRDDDYLVIPHELNVVPDYDTTVDKRERLIIESTDIAPRRRLMVHFLVKEDLPPEIANLQPGDHVRVSQLPPAVARRVSWNTIWFNFRAAFTRGRMLGKFGNSILYTSVSTFLIVMLGLMMGFALGKMGYKRISKFIQALIGLGYLIAFHSLLVPLFLTLSSLKLNDTRVGIMMVYVAFGLPSAVILSTQFIRELPDSLIESATIDGASIGRIFLGLIVPMSAPVAITVAIINALQIWNEFLLVMVLASSDATTSLPAGVFSFSSDTNIQAGWQMAALVIAIVPTLVIYFTFNQRLAKEVVAGSVKE